MFANYDTSTQKNRVLCTAIGMPIGIGMGIELIGVLNSQAY